MKLNIQTFLFNPFQENTYLVYDESKNALLIDPGCYIASEIKVIEEFIDQESLVLKAVLNTHCHIDHIFGNAYFVDRYTLPLYAHSADQVNLRGAVPYARMLGLPFSPSPEPSHDLADYDKLLWGDIELEVLFVPGHAPGHVAFWSREGNFVLSGDAVFKRSIGRTDLPGGNYEQLMQSITAEILRLEDEVRLLPGHGPETTVGEERRHNPFILEYLAN